MKVSELIIELQKFKIKYGDLLVYCDDTEWGPEEIQDIEFSTPSRKAYLDKIIIPERCNLE